MPTAEEVLIRLRAEAENGLREIDEAAAKVDRFREEIEGDVELNTDPAVASIDELRSRLARARTELEGIRDSASSASESTTALGGGLSNVQRSAAAAAVALAVGRAELKAIDELQEKLSDGLSALADDYPRLARSIEDVFGAVRLGVAGPFGKLNQILDDGIEAWKEYRRVFEPALDALVERGEDAQSVVEALFREIRDAGSDLKVAESNLLLAAQAIERTGEVSDASRVEIFKLAEALRQELVAAGKEVSSGLQELIEANREAGEAAAAASDRSIEAAQREADERERSAERIKEARRAQAEAFEAAADRELEQADRVLEREREVLEERLENLAEFRDRLEELRAAQNAFNESQEQGFDSGPVSETATELGRVQERLEELRDSSILTVEQLEEQNRLRERETDLLREVADEEQRAGDVAQDAARQTADEKRALAEVIEQARERLEEFKEGFGDLAPSAVGEIEAIIAQLEANADQVRINRDEVESLGIRLESAFERGIRKAEEQTRTLDEQLESLSSVGEEAETLGEKLAEALGSGIPLSQEQLQIFRQQADELTRQSQEAGRIADALGRTRETFEGFADQVEEELGPVGDQLASVAESSEGLADGTERSAAAVEKIVEVAPDLTAALKEQSTAVEAATPPIERFGEILEALAGNVQKTAEQSLEAATNQAELGTAVETSGRQAEAANRPWSETVRILDELREVQPQVAAGFDDLGARAEAAGNRASSALNQVLDLLRQIEAQAQRTAAAIDQIGSPSGGVL